MSTGAYPPAPVPDVIVPGTITTNGQAVTIDAQGLSSVIVYIGSTAWTGTIAFQFSQDNATWQTADAFPVEFGALATSTTANGQWRVSLPGFGFFRVTATAAITGTATIRLEGTVAPGFVRGIVNIADQLNGQGARVDTAILADGITPPSNGLTVESLPKLFNGATYDQLRDTSKTGAVDCAEQFMPVAEDNVNGIIATMQKPLATNTYAPSLLQAFGANAGVIKNGPGNLKGVDGVSRNTALRYLQLFNQTTTPVNTNVPILQFPINGAAANMTSEVERGIDLFAPNGIFFSVGIAYAFSTTSGSLTLGTNADHDLVAVFK